MSIEVQLFVAVQSAGTNPATLAGIWGPFHSEKAGQEWVASVDSPEDELTWSVVPLNMPDAWGMEAIND